MTKRQRAMLATNMLPEFETLAKQRQGIKTSSSTEEEPISGRWSISMILALAS